VSDQSSEQTIIAAFEAAQERKKNKDEGREEKKGSGSASEGQSSDVGPTRVRIVATAEQAPPMTIGFVVENTFEGSTANWLVKEFIEPDDEGTTENCFAVQESRVSGWLAADPSEGRRVDDHLLSTSAIRFANMAKDGTEYKCAFTQTFRKMRSGADGSEYITESGFSIVHTISWRNERWEYQSRKSPADVAAVSAGSGEVSTNWARVPVAL
jgi:hypothetical protein